jgi:hypothetical protein
MDNSTLKAMLFVSSGLSPIDAEKMRQAACLIEQLEARIEHLRTVANTKGVRSEEMASAVFSVLSSSFTADASGGAES